MTTEPNKLAVTTELSSLARRIREREENIIAAMRQFHGVTAELLAQGIEQGKDISAARAKIGKVIDMRVWLAAHVPQLSLERARKYERLVCEQITDVRQAVFAFLPPPAERRAEKKERVKHADWEVVRDLLYRVGRIKPTGEWPDDALAQARRYISEIAELYGMAVTLRDDSETETYRA